MSFAHYKEIKLYYIFYIQRRKNMTKILKFICVIILFLSVSLVGADFDSYTDLHDNNPESYECEVDEDCPQDPFTMKCINNICIG
ncbi:putative Late nodulin [Medicago truncatula]|uniref:Putative Late nodulin n=1 Tax=Medicago truncatula TaxID=3880 RepID=A0A396JKH2_MEDTR|nr:putative Late nodulin [Medicago truncatula]